MNAQGEDVVAGIRTPLPIPELQHISPDAYTELVDIGQTLEKHYRDMQDLEFTIQDGQLFIFADPERQANGARGSSHRC